MLIELKSENKKNRTLVFPEGPSINDITHLGWRGDLPKGDVTPEVYLVMSDKGKGRVKNL